MPPSTVTEPCREPRSHAAVANPHVVITASEPVAAVRRALIETVAMFEAGDGVRALRAARQALQASEGLVVDHPDAAFLRRVQVALDRGQLAQLEREARARIAAGGSSDSLGAPLLAEVAC